MEFQLIPAYYSKLSSEMEKCVISARIKWNLQEISQFTQFSRFSRISWNFIILTAKVGFAPFKTYALGNGFYGHFVIPGAINKITIEIDDFNGINAILQIFHLNSP